MTERKTPHVRVFGLDRGQYWCEGQTLDDYLAEEARAGYTYYETKDLKFGGLRVTTEYVDPAPPTLPRDI